MLIAHGERWHELDERRFVDYDAHGAVDGVELLHASLGINLNGLPEANRVAEAVRCLPSLAAALIEAPPAARGAFRGALLD